MKVMSLLRVRKLIVRERRQEYSYSWEVRNDWDMSEMVNMNLLTCFIFLPKNRSTRHWLRDYN